MDLLSLLPAFSFLVLVPVGLGLAFNKLGGFSDNDAYPALFTPLVNPAGRSSHPIIPEPEFVPFRLDVPRAVETTPRPARLRRTIGRPVPAPH